MDRFVTLKAIIRIPFLALVRVIFYALVEGPVFAVLAVVFGWLVLLSTGTFESYELPIASQPESGAAAPEFLLLLLLLMPFWAYFAIILGYPLFVFIAWYVSSKAPRNLKRALVARVGAFTLWCVGLRIWLEIMGGVPPGELAAMLVVVLTAGIPATLASEYLWQRLMKRYDRRRALRTTQQIKDVFT